jgi:membrane protein insertase Oxa1/YidC/SpoIIIJ
MVSPDKDPQFDDDVEIEVTRASKPWSQRAQLIAAVGWSSFMVAAVGTMLFFAFVDPAEMEATMAGRSVSRMTGYGMGFFFFWLLSAGAAAVAVYMVLSGRKNKRDRR